MLKVNKKHQNDVSDLVLVSLLLTLNIFYPFLNVFNVDFEQVFVCWNISVDTESIEINSNPGNINLLEVNNKKYVQS